MNARILKAVGVLAVCLAASSGFADDEVAANFSLAFDSKYMSYGLVDNNDPIMVPTASITFLDWLKIGVYSIFDITKYGRKAGYTDRSWRYIELHPNVELGHEFSADDYEWLPTTIGFYANYDYEYHPNSKWRDAKNAGDPYYKLWAEDSQFITLGLYLPDLWFEPSFYWERDIMRDQGSYFNLEIGHTFTLVEGESEDPILTLRASLSQGYGNSQRVAAYLVRDYDGAPLHHGGLVDTRAKLELTWNICENLSLSGYAAYTDILFDETIRDAAKEYRRTAYCFDKIDDTCNFTGGVTLSLAF